MNLGRQRIQLFLGNRLGIELRNLLFNRREMRREVCLALRLLGRKRRNRFLDDVKLGHDRVSYRRDSGC